MLDVEERVAVARRRSVRHRNDFDWLGDHYVNQEAPEVSLQGAWLLCTFFLCGAGLIAIFKEYIDNMCMGIGYKYIFLLQPILTYILKLQGVPINMGIKVLLQYRLCSVQYFTIT